MPIPKHQILYPTVGGLTPDQARLLHLLMSEGADFVVSGLDVLYDENKQTVRVTPGACLRDGVYIAFEDETSFPLSNVGRYTIVVKYKFGRDDKASIEAILYDQLNPDEHILLADIVDGVVDTSRRKVYPYLLVTHTEEPPMKSQDKVWLQLSTESLFVWTGKEWKRVVLVREPLAPILERVEIEYNADKFVRKVVYVAKDVSYFYDVSFTTNGLPTSITYTLTNNNIQIERHTFNIVYDNDGWVAGVVRTS